MDLTRYFQLLLAAFVARGAAWLDAHAPAGWADLLLAYMGDIHMSDGAHCIVGTLVRTDFMNGVAHSVANERDGGGFNEFLSKHRLGNGGAYGFNIPYDDDVPGDEALTLSENVTWTMLMECWRTEILSRVTRESVGVAMGRLARRQFEIAREREADETAVSNAEAVLADARRRQVEAEEAYAKADGEVEAARERRIAAGEQQTHAENDEYEANVALGDVQRTQREHDIKHVEAAAGIETLRAYLDRPEPVVVIAPQD